MRWYALAERLGAGTVDELKDRMTSAEFTRWIAYDEIHAENADQARRLQEKGMAPRLRSSSSRGRRG